MIERTTVDYYVNGKVFKCKASAQLCSDMDLVQEQLGALKEKLRALKSSCQHKELSACYISKTEQWSEDDGCGGSCAVTGKTYQEHLCNTCGVSVNVYADGTRKAGW